MVAAIALASADVAHAQAAWAHQNGSLTPGGAVVLRSLSGGGYSGTQNPAGAVAKGAQAAATQPATVLVQATTGGSIPLYLDGVYGKNISEQPEACPSGWIQVGLKIMEDATVAQMRRTCLPPEGKSCAVLYLEGMTGKNASEKPEICPASWIEVGFKVYKYTNPSSSYIGLMKRSCIRC